MFRIIAIKLIMEQPQNYGFILQQADYYQPYTTEKVSVTEEITDLNTFALEHRTNLKLLKLLNPWLIADRVSIPSDQESLEIQIPIPASRLRVLSHSTN